MPGPFDVLGAVLGGKGDTEKSYEEGRALGAKTEEALANARRRVMENDALARGRQSLVAAGVPDAQADAAYTALQGGAKLDDPIQLMLKNQEFTNNQRIGDPNVPLDEAQRLVLTKSTNPVEPLYKVGGGYGNKFDSASGVTPLPAGASGGPGGGVSATMQFLRARGALDDAGNIRPGWENYAAHVLHPTTKSVVVNGVPTMVSDSPEQYAPGAAAPSQPHVPGAAPAPAAPAAASVVAQPLSTTASEAASAGQIAAGKAQGEAQGKNAASLPTALNTIDTFTNDITNLVNSPGFNSIYGARVGTPVGQAVTTFASQDAADAAALREKVNAESFRASINSMRGLGQLSNAEGSKVQAALTTLANPHLSPEAARAAAEQLKLHLADLKRVAQIEANQGAAPASPTNPAAPIVKMIGGKKYVSQDGKNWFEDDGVQ
jgi:hypothetical protein